MIAQQDDPKLFAWILNAQRRGGGFVSTIAEAALAADWENYDILRPALLELQKKYPRYNEARALSDPTCPRCGHVHEGSGECGVSIGAGRVCRCELEMS